MINPAVCYPKDFDVNYQRSKSSVINLSRELKTKYSLVFDGTLNYIIPSSEFNSDDMELVKESNNFGVLELLCEELNRNI